MQPPLEVIPRRCDHIVPAPAAAHLDVLARGPFRAARPPGCPCRLEVLPCAGYFCFNNLAASGIK